MSTVRFSLAFARWYLSVGILSSGVVFASTTDLLIRFQPTVVDQQAAIATIAADIPGHSGATLADGVWTLRNVPETVRRALRERADVAWAERASTHTITKEEREASSQRNHIYHPRLLRVRLNGAELISTEFAKASLLPKFRDATGHDVHLARVNPGAQSISVLASRGTGAAGIDKIADALRALPGVLGVDRVRLVRPLQTFSQQGQPNDPMYFLQWPLHDRDAGIQIAGAWAAAGSSPVTVAVIDTGSTAHPELDYKWVPGYDFVSERYISVDGDGRDSDPNDEGDYSDFGECGYWFWGSSWHGTHVAGIIAAQTNNGEGIAGVAPNARIQPVRVLGRCGGLEEDIVDSIKWAAGLPVDGAPTNRNPAKVINLSLGGPGACSQEMQDAVNAAVARNVTVVVAAGNEADDAKFYFPSSCKGVITVAATSRLADLSSYSNYGDTVEISAPGGDYDGYQQVLSTLNSGAAGPSTSFYQPYAGTSMAAPHVAGVVALMLSRDPSMTPGQIVNRLQATSSYANSAPVGLVNASAAVAATPDRRTSRQSTSVPGRMRLIELWDRSTNRFVTTGDLHEERALTSGVFGGNWVVTSHFADAFDFTANSPSFVVPQPVCRYRSLATGATRLAVDRGVCEQMRESSAWVSDGWAFQAAIANGNSCAAGTVPVYELNASGRYRYAWSTLERDASVAAGWGWSTVAFCLPAQ